MPQRFRSPGNEKARRCPMTFGPASSAFGLLAQQQTKLRNKELFSKPSWQPSPAPCGLQNFWPRSTRLATRGASVGHTNGSLLTARDGNRSRPTRRHAHLLRRARDEKGAKPCPTKRSTPATQRRTTSHVRSPTLHLPEQLSRHRRQQPKRNQQQSHLHLRRALTQLPACHPTAHRRVKGAVVRVAVADLVAGAIEIVRAELRAEQTR